MILTMLERHNVREKYPSSTTTSVNHQQNLQPSLVHMGLNVCDLGSTETPGYSYPSVCDVYY